MGLTRNNFILVCFALHPKRWGKQRKVPNLLPWKKWSPKNPLKSKPLYLFIFFSLKFFILFSLISSTFCFYVLDSVTNNRFWTQKRMITMKRSSQEMCKPYCVVYHCYLSSFPLNFVSIYKSLYIYIYRFLVLNFGIGALEFVRVYIVL